MSSTTTKTIPSSQQQQQQQQQLGHTVTSFGKNAAIRQIMRERSEKKMMIDKNCTNKNDSTSTFPSKRGEITPVAASIKHPLHDSTNSLRLQQHHHHQVNDSSCDDKNISSIEEEDNDRTIPLRTVTFHDNLYYDYDKNLHLLVEQNVTKNDDCNINNINDVSSSSSLSSSHWALMQYDTTLGSCINIDGRNALEYDRERTEDLMLELLLDTSSVMTIKTPSHHKLQPQQQQHVPDHDMRPTVTSDTGKGIRRNYAVSSSATNGAEVDVSIENNEYNNGRDDIVDCMQNDALSNPIIINAGITPFHTFRQNSASIALDETQYYIQTIQLLRQQLQDVQNENDDLQQQLLSSQQQQEQQIDDQEQPNEELESHTGDEQHQQNRKSQKSVRIENIPSPRHFQTPRSAITNNGFFGTTPHTKTSTLTSTTTLETVWERNKTLVTEIRFADQTCVEMSYEKKMLEERYNTLQNQHNDLLSKYETLQKENDTQRMQHQKVSSSTLSDTLDIDYVVQKSEKENEAAVSMLEQQLHEAQEQITILRDEMIENYELSQETITKQQNHILQLEIQVQALQQESANTSNDDSHDKVKDLLSNVVHTMNVKMDILQSTISNKINTFDAQLDYLNHNIQYMEDALLQEEDTDENDNDESHEGKSNMDNCTSDPSNENVSSASAVNVTFSKHLHNETIDLAMMEEARCADDDSAASGEMNSLLSTPDTTNVTPNKLQSNPYYFDGLSRVLSDDDFQTLTVDNENKASHPFDTLYNSKFLPHLQWLTKKTPTPKTMQQIHNIIDEPSPITKKSSPSTVGVENCNRIAEQQRIVFPSQFHHGMKNLCPYDDNLSYSESDNSSFIHHDITQSKIMEQPLADVTRILDNIPKDDTLTLDRLQSLKGEKEELSTMLEESLDQISKLNEIAEKHERQICIKEGALTMEKRLVEKELEVVEKKLDQATESLKNIASTELVETEIALLSFCDKAPLNANLQLHDEIKILHDERNNLISKLSITSNELAEATNRINILQGEAFRREKLMKRYELLQREKDEADVSLREKCIVPRKVPSPAVEQKNQELVGDLNQQIAAFRVEICTLTQKIDTLTSKFDVVNAEKSDEIEKLNKHVASLTSERKSMQLELQIALQRNEAISSDKRALQEEIKQQLSKIETSDNLIYQIQQQLLESESEANKQRIHIEQNEERLQNFAEDLKKLQHERDKLVNEISALTVRGNRLEDEICRNEVELNEKNDAIAEAMNMKLEAEVRNSNAETEMQKVIDTLKTEETKRMQLDKENQVLRVKLLQSDKAKSVAEHERSNMESACASLKAEWTLAIDALQQLKVAKNDVDEALRQALHLQEQKDIELEKTINELSQSHERFETYEAELRSTIQSLQDAVLENSTLRGTNEALVLKCNKLRDYIRKVTAKCQEWEVYHERESDVLIRLHTAYKRSRQEASELSMICQEKDQRVLMLQDAHRDLENDIDEIARELTNISQYDDVLFDVSTTMFVQ